MERTKTRLQELIRKNSEYLFSCSDEQLRFKPAPGKWSKIEILGHLIDSGINNLQRFTEIQFKPKPFSFQNYSQDELVIANDYQHASLKELIDLYTNINLRIIRLMIQQTQETLKYEIMNPSNGEKVDLRFLMEDYVVHMEHHMKQLGSLDS